MTYLLRPGGKHREGYDLVWTGEEFSAAFPEINRVKRTRNVGGLLFNEVEGTGTYDRRHVSIHLGSHSAHTAVTSDGIKDVLREMRSQDAVTLQDYDTEIAELERQLAQARKARGQLLHDAFRRGGRVLPPEVIRAADARHAYFEQRKREAAGG